MFEQLKNDFLEAVDAKDYQKANLLLQDLLPYLGESEQEKIKALLVKAINEVADQSPDSLSTQEASRDGADDGTPDKDKADLTNVDWGGITGAALGGVAAIINAANGTTPDNSTNVTNNSNASPEMAKPPTSTLWYVGGGIAAVLLVVILLVLANKKTK